MINALRFAISRPRSLPKLDPVGALIRLDAEYRQRRRVEELTDTQLDDMGITRADIYRALRRG